MREVVRRRQTGVKEGLKRTHFYIPFVVARDKRQAKGDKTKEMEDFFT
jgi:hypothetical protein